MGWDEAEMSTNGDPLDNLLGGNLPQSIEEDEGIDLLANPAAFRAIERGEPLAPVTPSVEEINAALYQEQKSERAFVLEATANALAGNAPDVDTLLSAAEQVLAWLQTGQRGPWLPGDGPDAPSPGKDTGTAPEAADGAQTAPGAGVDADGDAL